MKIRHYQNGPFLTIFCYPIAIHAARDVSSVAYYFK